MQDQALAVAETQPQAPALPRQLVAVEGERDPVGLPDVQGLEVGALLEARHVLRHVLALHLGEPGRRGVLDLQQLHRVEVDHELQPAHRVGVGVGVGGVAQPDVAPADAAALVGGGDEVGAVGPDVDEHEIGIGDPALGERGEDVGVAAHGRVAVVPLVDGGVGLLARLGVPGQQGVVGEREHADVGGAVVGVPGDDAGLARDRVAGLERAHHVLRRLPQLDRSDAPVRAGDVLLAPEDLRHRAELLGGQRVERVVAHGAPSGTVVAFVTWLPTVCGSAGSVRNVTVHEAGGDRLVLGGHHGEEEQQRRPLRRRARRAGPCRERLRDRDHREDREDSIWKPTSTICSRSVVLMPR